MLGRFKIGFCVQIGFYLVVNPFLSWVRSGEFQVIRSVLNPSSLVICLSFLIFIMCADLVIGETLKRELFSLIKAFESNGRRMSYVYGSFVFTHGS